MRRTLAVAALALAGSILLPATPASAHALLGSSDPERGSALDEAPRRVAIRFTEEPELSLSDVDVLDASGRSFAGGEVEQDASDPLVLRRDVAALDDGVYTVTWRVLSRVDGHVTAGAFAFGVGVDPSEIEAADVPEDTAPPPSRLEMVARWLLYAGLGLALGVAWLGAAAFREVPGGVWRLVGGAWVASVAGLALLAEAQRRAAGGALGDLLATPIGRALIWRAVAIGLMGALLVLARAQVGTPRAATLGLVGLAAGGGIFVHVASGHAGDGWPQQVIGQWVHFVAAGVWLGGLAALIAGVRGAPDEDKARAVRRFSTVAGVALFVVFGSGVARSLNELPSIADAWSSSYGIVILVKVGLIGALGLLGLRNRRRNVPVAASSLTGLRRVSRAELGVGAGVIAAAAVLASLTPPAAVSAVEAIATDPIVATGTDVGGRARVELRIDPGFPGPNTFTARAIDARSGGPFEADTARLLFGYVEDASLGESELVLEPVEPGTWRATGPQMALPGRWRIAVLLQGATTAVEVPVQTATKCRAGAFPVEGGPTLYDLPAGANTGQGYVDPGATGFNEVHITFFDPEGNELPIPAEPDMFATPPDGDRVEMVVRRFSDGHFIGDAQLTPGVWRFDVDARAPDGETVRVCFNEEIR